MHGRVAVFCPQLVAAYAFRFAVVTLGVLLSGAAYCPCLVAATIGNFLGGMTCYWMGMLGKTEWLEKYLKEYQFCKNF
ncbi:hypothetical protein Barb4_00561 [Bacteroidales bacterium Barb4]|nr:hypothetical protein Barb4_00561 [Bacteroidales bacterium Barb4]